MKLIKNTPAIGWIRADQVGETVSADILRLRNGIEELEAGIQASRETAPAGSETLAQGDDLFRVEFTVLATERKTGSAFDLISNPPEKTRYSDNFKASWNDIFSAVAPLMIDEAPDYKIKDGLNSFTRERNTERLQKRKELDGYGLSEFQVLKDDSFQTIKVQFRALGLISKSQRPRSVKDTDTYWALTPYGDAVMTRLRAIRRDS